MRCSQNFYEPGHALPAVHTNLSWPLRFNTCQRVGPGRRCELEGRSGVGVELSSESEEEANVEYFKPVATETRPIGIRPLGMSQACLSEPEVSEPIF